MENRRDDHVTLEQWLLALRGDLPLAALLRRAHRHLLDGCRTCRGTWAREGGPAPPPFGAEPGPGDSEEAGHADVERAIRRQSILRRLHREAREDFEDLLRLPREEWPGKVDRARTRWRSRACAQRLLAECRDRVKAAPEIAADLAGLVPRVLGWALRRQRPWARALVTRAEAHRANALRVAGDLPAAEATFSRIAEELARAPLECPETGVAVHAEVLALQASLRVAQRRYPEADVLLRQAAGREEEGGDRVASARIFVQRANLARVLDDARTALSHHRRAAAMVDPEAAPYVHLSTVTGRINALCDLGRPQEAQRLLHEHRSAYREVGGAYGAAMWECLRGRLALCQEAAEDAVTWLQQGRDGLLELGRNFDGALASLDLATAYLGAGRLEELRSLAAELYPVFRGLGVAPEALASLRLLVEAEVRQASATALFQKLRRILELQAAQELS